jgi:hypothetical protein
MTGCLQWLDAVGLKDGGSPPDKRRKGVGPHPEARAREPKSPQVERREAPFPDRKGKGDAFARCLGRLHAKPAQGSDRKDPAFPGAPLPSIFGSTNEGLPGADIKNTGGGALACRAEAQARRRAV